MPGHSVVYRAATAEPDTLAGYKGYMAEAKSTLKYFADLL
jgi:hypothetical protein